MKTLFDCDTKGYQRYMTRKIGELLADEPHAAGLAVDMSLGKTAATLEYLYTALQEDPDLNVLVIAPKRVAEETWPEEIRRWYHFRKFFKGKYAVMVGEPDERVRARMKDVPIHIINKENLQWLWERLRNGKDWDYDLMIIDEASMLKEGKKRTKRAGGGEGSRPLSRFGIIARAREKTKYVIELTGTPYPEGVEDMWGLNYVMDLGQRLGRNKTAFHKRWFSRGYNRWDIKPLPHAQDEMNRLVSDMWISLRAEDHLELPPVITTPDTDIWVTMPRELMKEYRRFERTLFSEQYDVEAVSKGVLTNKLLQFANGSLYRERGKAIHVHDLKVDALEELLDRLGGEPLLLAYSYKFDRERIRKRLGRRVTFLDEAGKNAIKDWNRGKIKCLAQDPRSISHGMNMQFGGFHACWYGLCHSGETYRQFNARLPRPGQAAEHVYIHHILTRGTWDEKAIINQQMKGNNEAALREAIRVRAREIELEMRIAA